VWEKDLVPEEHGMQDALVYFLDERLRHPVIAPVDTQGSGEEVHQR
jgi:hypothetical protein